MRFLNNELFGVNIANLKKNQKQIKKDPKLSIQLWKTKNYEAIMLATYIADPEMMTVGLANKWVNSIEYYILSETLASLIAKTPVWRELINNWMESDKEYVKSTAYYVPASVLKSNKEVSEDEIREQLTIIKSQIHTESNRVKHTMNNLIIAIGIFRPEFEKQALKVAKEIGKVVVDHGKTNCKTPDATEYIQQAITRNKSRKKKR